jgi:hypothetical protein
MLHLYFIAAQHYGALSQRGMAKDPGVKEWNDAVAAIAVYVRILVEILHLKDYFDYDGLILVSRDGSKRRYYLAAEVRPPEYDEIVEVEALAAENDQDGIVRYLLERRILREA